MHNVTAAIQDAMKAAGLSQRQLASTTQISQPTLSRILNGGREAKLPELVLIAQATGTSLTQLTGTGIAERVECAARATNGSDMTAMRQQLIRYMEFDAHLDDYAIPAS